MDDGELISGLAVRLRETVRSLVPPGAAVGLVGFPNHSNPGDSAIWLGVLSLLRDLGCRVVYTCDFHTYDRTALQQAVDSGPILITGGGNFGDLYPAEQELRECVVRDFPENPIIQLSQSIHFRDQDSARRASKVLRAHRSFALMVRDRVSAEIAVEVLGIEPTLSPDCAFLLGRLDRLRTPIRPVTVVRRNDSEAAMSEAAVDGVTPFDWMDEPGRPLPRAALYVRHYARDHPARRAPAGRVMSIMYGPLARRRLGRGIRLLSSGRVVVTDRLHGHILALLLGIPHVVTDTAQGKISAFVETWTASSELVRTARDFRHAWDLACSWDEQLAVEGPA